MTWLPNKNVAATFCFRNKFDVSLPNNTKRYNHGRCNNACIKSRVRGSFRKCKATQSVRGGGRKLGGNLMPLILMPEEIKAVFMYCTNSIGLVCAITIVVSTTCRVKEHT